MKEVVKIVEAIAGFVGKVFEFAKKEEQKAVALVQKIHPAIVDCEVEIAKIMADLKDPNDPLVKDCEALLQDIITIKNLL